MVNEPSGLSSCIFTTILYAQTFVTKSQKRSFNYNFDGGSSRIATSACV